MTNLLKTLFLSLCVCLFVASCNNGEIQSEEQVSESEAEIMNDSIQGTFLNVKFGDLEKDVKANFMKLGLISDDGKVYYSRNGKSISFGDFSWDDLIVLYKNDKLSQIIFTKGYDDKAAALSDYDAIYKAFSKQYTFTDQDLVAFDLKSTLAEGKDDRFASLNCRSYESDKVEHEHNFYVTFAFWDANIISESESE